MYGAGQEHLPLHGMDQNSESLSSIIVMAIMKYTLRALTQKETKSEMSSTSAVLPKLHQTPI